jgi:hypothetical protein
MDPISVDWHFRQERRILRARAWYNAAITGVVAKGDALEALTVIEDQVLRDQPPRVLDLTKGIGQDV